MVENRATGSTKATQPKLGDYKQPEGAKKVMGNTVGSALRNPENSPNYLRKKGGKMLTIIEIDKEQIWLRSLAASAASGNVLPGAPEKYTDQEIQDWADENLAAPDEGDYQGFEVVR